MRPLTLALVLTLCALLGFAATRGVREIAYAQGEQAAAQPMADAGAPAPVTAADPAPATPDITTPNPLEQPGEALSAWRVAYKVGPLFSVLFVLLTLARLIQTYAKEGTWLGDKLGKGRAAMFAASAVTILTAVMAGLTKTVPWGAVIVVVVPALLVTVSPVLLPKKAP